MQHNMTALHGTQTEVCPTVGDLEHQKWMAKSQKKLVDEGYVMAYHGIVHVNNCLIGWWFGT